jgi:hypothetical protein
VIVMTIDLTNLTQTTDELISSLESDFPEMDAEIGDLTIIVEIRVGEDRRQVRARSRKGMPPHARLGLLGEAESLWTVNKTRAMMESESQQRECGSS